MFPQFSTINSKVVSKINNDGVINMTQKMPWIRVISGAGGTGLVMYSNMDAKLFSGMTEASTYGDTYNSGFIGYTWNEANPKPIYPISDNATHRPSPVITGMTIKEGKDQISRHCELTVKAFTLGQINTLQQYLMEPGYSLLIEYGWNTVSAVKKLISISSKNYGSLVNNASTWNLDTDKLQERRLAANCEYDSFLGFIVGGSTNSENDGTFTLTIKLRGAPSLPSYLQGYQNIKKIKDGKVSSENSVSPFPVSDLNGENTEAVQRRLKYMFNSLPSHRRNNDVLENVLKNKSYTLSDFINFDKKIEDEIGQSSVETHWYGDDTKATEEHKGVTITKETLYSKNKYIRFQLAVDILNANTSLDSFGYGNQKIKNKIEIEDSIIGAFPLIFSTKPEKLVIPTETPDFTAFVLSESENPSSYVGLLKKDNRIVSTNTTITGTNTVTVIDTIDFVGQEDLEPKTITKKGATSAGGGKGASTLEVSRGFKEKKGYYGYLKNLYINFDVFLKELEAKNKTSKQVLESLLNEMSSAVNSFWKFQIVEQPVEEKDEKGNVKKSYTAITVIDENFVGENTAKIVEFFHTGTNSRFLNAELSMDIPGQMASMIVSKRLALSTNPDAPNIKLGGLFSESTDLFLKAYIDRGGKVAKEKEEPHELTDEESKALKKDIEEKYGTFKFVDPTTGEEAVVNIKGAGGEGKFQPFSNTEKKWSSEELAKQAAKIDEDERAINKTAVNNEIKKRQIQKLKTDGKTDDDAEIKKLEAEIKADDASAAKASEELDKKKQELRTKNEETRKGNITKNLNMVDICINPVKDDPGQSAIDNILFAKDTFDETFRIYCCKDTDLFDTLRSNAFNGTATESKGRYSPPLPIKYNFTVPGVSGIIRGDIFRINGIPEKYRTSGFFQITEIEQFLDNSGWKTTVTGEYRQYQ